MYLNIAQPPPPQFWLSFTVNLGLARFFIVCHLSPVPVENHATQLPQVFIQSVQRTVPTHKTVLIIVLLILQTIVIGQILYVAWKKGKGFPYSLRVFGPELIPVYMQCAHPPGGRLPLLSIRPLVTFPATEHHCLLAGTKLYCLVTEAHACEQLAQGCYAALPRVSFEPMTCWSQVQSSTHCATVPLMLHGTGEKKRHLTTPCSVCVN